MFVRDSITTDIQVHYESIYQCLCANYSEAYLKGSDFYVGDCLYDWWVQIETEKEKKKEKNMKWVYIKNILDDFIKMENSIQTTNSS